MSIHANLTGADLHEPKGVASASAGTVYVANGSGSGTWEAPAQVVALTRTMPNVSSAGTVYVVSPVAGMITAIYVVLEGTLATADDALTFAINGSAITGSGITIDYDGGGAGTEYSSTPSGANTVAAGSVISMTTAGTCTNTVPVTVTFLINVPA